MYQNKTEHKLKVLEHWLKIMESVRIFNNKTSGYEGFQSLCPIAKH